MTKSRPPAAPKTSPHPEGSRAPTTATAGHASEPSADQVDSAVRSFALLADPTRVRMLWALREVEADVTTLAAVAGCSPTAASQHLSKLRFAGLVTARREGRHAIYQLRGGHVRRLLAEALSQADHHVTGTPPHD